MNNREAPRWVVALMALTILHPELVSEAMIVRVGHDSHLGHFTKGATFFPEINDHAAATFLGLLDGLLNAEDNYGKHVVSVGH